MKSSLLWISLSIILIFVLGCLVILQPLLSIIDKIADDAFYYLTIARNITRGTGISFDGLKPTNGFHPLYLFSLIPGFLLFPGNSYFNVKIALLIGLFSYILTVFPFYFLTKYVYKERTAVFATLCWLLNPWGLAITLNGVESGLYILLVALTSYLYIRIKMVVSQAALRRNSLLMGISLGLTYLARSDAAFLMIGIFLDWIFLYAMRGSSEKYILFWDRAKILALFHMLLSSCLVILPWNAWNIITFGSILQTSGAAIYWNTHQGVKLLSMTFFSALTNSTLNMLNLGILFCFQAFCFFIVYLFIKLLPSFRKTFKGHSRIHKGQDHSLLFFFWFYIFSIFAFYSWFLLYQQAWYFMPILLGVALSFGWLLEYILRRAEEKNHQLVKFFKKLIAVYLPATFLLGIFLWQNKGRINYPAQKDGYQIASWLSTHTEPKARIGSWNSGILGYYSNRTVINLDGVVNNRLVYFLKQKKGFVYDLDILSQYIQNEKIEYVTDYDHIPVKMSRLTTTHFHPVYKFLSSADSKFIITVYQYLP